MQQTSPPPVAHAISIEQVPPDVLQGAANYQLDDFFTMYRPTFTNPLAIIVLASAVIIVDCLLAAAIYNIGFIVYLLVFVPFIVVIYAIIGLLNCNLRVYVFKNGLVRAKGRSLEIIRWDSVEAVWLNIIRNRYGGTTTHTYTLRRRDGTKVKFSAVLKNVGLLGQTIQQEVMLIHMPLAITAYNSGNVVGFGPLTMSLQGISNGKETLPWNLVQSVTVKQGYIFIHKVGKKTRWGYVRVSKVPNFLVFMNMVNYARGGQH